MTEYAPILVSVYDRRKHLMQCIDALKRNPEASESELYIVSDGPQKPEHNDAIESVREYIRSIRGFKAVKHLFREENWGMRRSGLDAIAWVLSEHDRLIRLEDDIICANTFLRFMNDSLGVFDHDNRVFGICAYMPNVPSLMKICSDEIFLWNSFSPWGFATWKNRWDEYIRNESDEYKQAEDKRVWRGLINIRPYLQTHKEFLHNIPHNDAKIALHIYLAKLLCVFPVRSLTINAGMDGSGAHCGLGWTYGRQSLGEGPISITPNVEPSERIAKKLYWAHYSFINHGLGKVLRHMGIFDPLYEIYKVFFCHKGT